jgi:hypothetical protein
VTDYRTESPFDADVFETVEAPPEGEPMIVEPPVEGSHPRSMAVAVAPAPGQTDRPHIPVDHGLPTALMYGSQDGGTGYGHMVIVQANNELTCTCWPGLRTAKGCHAMVAARKLLGMPEVE